MEIPYAEAASIPQSALRRLCGPIRRVCHPVFAKVRGSDETRQVKFADAHDGAEGADEIENTGLVFLAAIQRVHESVWQHPNCDFHRFLQIRFVEQKTCGNL